MTHGDVRELIAPFAVGALEEPESSLVRLHLDECAFCTNLAREATEVAHCLGQAVPQKAPPAGSLDRLLASLDQPRQPHERTPVAPPTASHAATAPRESRFGWLRSAFRPSFAPLAASLLLVLGLGAWNVALLNELRSERRDVQNMQTRLAQQSHVLLLATSRSAVSRPLEGTAMAPSAQVRLIMDAETNSAMIMANQMPALQRGYVYQVWLGRQGARMPACKLWVDEQGDGECSLQLDASIHSYDSAWITLEPMEGTKPNSPGIAKGVL